MVRFTCKTSCCRRYPKMPLWGDNHIFHFGTKFIIIFIWCKAIIDHDLGRHTTVVDYFKINFSILWLIVFTLASFYCYNSFCMWILCVFVFACGCACGGWSWHWVSSSTTFPFIYWIRVPTLIPELSDCLDQQAILPWLLSAGIPGGHTPSQFLHSFQGSELCLSDLHWAIFIHSPALQRIICDKLTY